MRGRRISDLTPEAFRTIRKEAGLTQDELATRLEISRRSVQAYEKVGRIPSVIAAAMGMLKLLPSDPEGTRRLIDDEFLWAKVSNG